MASTDGGRDAAIEPQGMVYGLLTIGSAPALSLK